MKFTQAAIASFKLPRGKTDHTIFDDELPGFGLRVRTGKHGESRIYFYQYKFGRTRKFKIGTPTDITCADARKIADAKKGEVSRARLGFGNDPATERDKKKIELSLVKLTGNSLKHIVEIYLEAIQSEQRPRTYEATSYYLNDLWSNLHKLAIDTVSKPDVAVELAAIAKKNGKISANRARAALSAMFRWANEKTLCSHNPVVGTYKEKENPCDRVLLELDENGNIKSLSETIAVWTAADTNSDFHRIVRLILLTGCRRDEIGGLQWSEIDLEARTITLPPDRTKNGQAHIVPLCDAALEILKAIPRRQGFGNVFGRGKNGYSGWSKSKVEIDKIAKLKTPWTLHDLRRTLNTGMDALGVQPNVADAVLNHKPPKLRQTYRPQNPNNYGALKRTALNEWANHLFVAIAQASGANVTRLTVKEIAN
jgi:integrase